MGLESCIQFSLHLGCASVGMDDGEDGIHAVVWLALESLDFALTFNDEAHCHTLHATCRECRFHLAPKHWREFETHDAVEHAACLLGVYQIHVKMTWRLDSF